MIEPAGQIVIIIVRPTPPYTHFPHRLTHLLQWNPKSPQYHGAQCRSLLLRETGKKLEVPTLPDVVAGT